MLNLPDIQKLNLRCSAWIMSRVSVSRRELRLSESKVLKFYAEDVFKVFGIPCENRSMKGRDANINPEAIHFIKSTLEMNKTGVHSLRVAEQFLMHDINENSSKLEKDYFQIAFVIFVMGHVLAPTTKHNYSTIDFWGAIANTEMIQQFNWCEYVLQHLLDTVRKLKRDMMMNNHSTNLTGCHFFFQVFLLDNLDLGILNKPHNVLPRIIDFDPDTLNKMLIMALDPVKGSMSYSHANLRDPANVCYVRHKVQYTIPSSSTTKQLPRAGTTPRSAKTPTTESPCPGTGCRQENFATPNTMPRVVGPLDLANFLRQQYPHLVTDEITMIMKQQNASSIRRLTEASNAIQVVLSQAKNALQSDMLNYSEKILKSISGRRLCCRTRGFTECHASGAATAKNVCFSTPVGQRIQGHMLDLSDGEGSVPTPAYSMSPLNQGGSSRKRNASNEDSASARKKLISESSIVINYFKDTIREVAQMYADLPAKTTVACLAKPRVNFQRGSTFFSMVMQQIHGSVEFYHYHRTLKPHI
ncbi:uncharacterized protein [Triticum aestivum]|uniref:uncharacterized protein isoform X2 n=1 Tax=Triticum aestivum TaxID=4565 RepID=UPI001D00BFD7|nr:uncharacterized protein LOC123148138 isoform X2 [Triticum aestivum]XP_044423437.1 uncharacterized protein LOC123148138 isoform X2 [Triticum aestivum]